MCKQTCRQHGNRQDPHANGLERWITSRSLASLTLMSKGRIDPQQFLVQQSVSSFAEYNSLPWESLTLYLFFVSQPKNAVNINFESISIPKLRTIVTVSY